MHKGQKKLIQARVLDVMDSLKLQIVLILTVGFGFASILGFLSFKMKLSPILGYLVAGYLIGPYSPGYIADMQISEQLAEIGVVLMMFGVGLQFKWRDLLHTSKIAIPGAIMQTFTTAIIGATLIHSMGWSLEAGIVLGIAIGVASTVVLTRVLSDNKILNTSQGHITVGWLIVEDIITVIALLLISPLADAMKGHEFPLLSTISSFGGTLIKFTLFSIALFTFGEKIISRILSEVLQTKYQELFTLTILTITFIIATGSTFLLGTSIALGAFIAGMVIGQTSMREHVSLNTRPLKDAFVVIFFLSIGMLFNPSAITLNLTLFIGVLAIIMIIKPLLAFLITCIFGYPFKTALTVGLALAQVGEFSFILAEEAMKNQILPDQGYDIIVACSLVSISVNPLLFKLVSK